jgi:hypothetical protein
MHAFSIEIENLLYNIARSRNSWSTNLGSKYISRKLGSINSGTTLLYFGGIDLGPIRGSSTKFEPDFRFKVNKAKARARLSLISQSSVDLFL